MMEHALQVLADLPEAGAPALNLHEVGPPNVALNGLLLNVRGSLDNAAWALTHHYSLVPSPSEADSKHRTFVSLFGPKFLRALRRHDGELSERLKALSAWGRALAEVRDPAAHRIPLYIAPSVVDEAGAERIRVIDRAIEEAAAAKDWDRLRTLQRERWEQGAFHPVVTLWRQDGLGYGSLASLLDRDIGGMLDATELALRFTFAEDAWTVSTNNGPLPSRRGERWRDGGT
jgi:hypothetical protein